LGATLPAGSAGQSFILEVLLTAILMLVVLNVSQGAKEKGITAGLVIGGVIGWEAMFAGPISGASMNPARSLAPARSLWKFGRSVDLPDRSVPRRSTWRVRLPGNAGQGQSL